MIGVKWAEVEIGSVWLVRRRFDSEPTRAMVIHKSSMPSYQRGRGWNQLAPRSESVRLADAATGEVWGSYDVSQLARLIDKPS